MSAKVQGWVWDQDLPAQPKLILLWLANRATDLGVCFPSKRELGLRTGLSERMVRYHLAWLASDRDEQHRPRVSLLHIIERPVAAERNTTNVYVIRVPWATSEAVRLELDELKHIPSAAIRGLGAMGCTQSSTDDYPLHPLGATGDTQVGATGCMENRSLRNSHRNTPPGPPEEAQQRGDGLAETKPTVVSAPKPGPDEADQVQALVIGFYRGLGTDLASITQTLRRRDAAIARQLIEIGASPGEAEAYARDASQQPGRIAAIDLRSFERERAGWLARRRSADTTARRYVDRTGQPPAWLSTGSDGQCGWPRAADDERSRSGRQAKLPMPGDAEHDLLVPPRTATGLSHERLGAVLGLALQGTH